jgi:hypothetical protein
MASLAGVFVLGALSGVLFQRQVGVGRVLRPARPPVQERPSGGIPGELQGTLSLFVLAGQSNMCGYAPLPAMQALDPRAFLFGNDYRWRQASEPTDDPTDQVDRVSRDRDVGTSPGLSFARAMLEARPQGAIGLIPCAKGDSTILDWRRAGGEDTLYGSCLKRIAAASSMGRLAGVLFFQGETDALDPARARGRALSANAYGKRLEALVRNLRNDLESPLLPVVFAQIGGQGMPEAYPNWQRVQEQQAEVQLPCVAMIRTADLPLRDHVHFTTESYEEIGRRFARAYLDLTTSQGCD